MPVWLKEFFGDRIQINSALIVLCFVSVLALSSQSAASYPSYLLGVSMLITYRQWNDVFATPLAWLVIALLGYLCLSAFWSEAASKREMFGIGVRGLLVFTFMVSLAECQLRGQVQRWLARALAVVGSLAAMGAIVLYLLEPNSHGRLFGLGQLNNPVVAALVFGAVVVLVLQMLFVESDLRWKVIAVVSLLVVMLAVYLTGSRNAWVSVSCAVGMLFLAHRIPDRQRLVAGFAALLVVVGVALAALLMNDVSREFLLPRGDSFRLEIWSFVIEKTWNEAPWFGFGILTPDQIPIDDRLFSHPHSMYLTVFFQGGTFGLTLFGLLTAATLKVLIAEYQLPSAKLALGLLTLAMVSYLLDGHELVDKVGETWFLYWLPVGLAVGIQWNRFVETAEQ